MGLRSPSPLIGWPAWRKQRQEIEELASSSKTAKPIKVKTFEC
jgi:hypothetical protein